jgi:hypothetical protein
MSPLSAGCGSYEFKRGLPEEQLQKSPLRGGIWPIIVGSATGRRRLAGLITTMLDSR